MAWRLTEEGWENMTDRQAAAFDKQKAEKEAAEKKAAEEAAIMAQQAAGSSQQTDLDLNPSETPEVKE